MVTCNWLLLWPQPAESPGLGARATMSQAVQTNETQLLRKTWELSLYNLQWTSQEAIRDSLNMLKTTMTTKDCLHRFCADRVTTTHRSGGKEYPTHQKKLVSKRSLRSDPNCDVLISKIYPSHDEYEAHQERLLARISKHSTHKDSITALRKDRRYRPWTHYSQGKKQQIENGAKDNGDSSHCSNASTYCNQEAGPSNKGTKTTNDSGLELDNINAIVATDPVMDVVTVISTRYIL